MTFHIITLFPEMFNSYLNESILARGQKENKIKFHFYNPRDYAYPTKASAQRVKVDRNYKKPYLRVDDRPYGGGPGMVMQAEPIIKAIENALGKINSSSRTSKTQFTTGPSYNSLYKFIFLSSCWVLFYYVFDMSLVGL